MTKKDLKELLKTKPSYTKKGAKWLSVKYELSIEDVKSVLSSVQDEVKDYRSTTPVEQAKRGKMNFFKDIATPKDYTAPKFKTIIKPKKKTGNNILVIGDIHEPFALDGYLEHCLEVQDNYSCNKVVYIGDLIDNHAISAHEHDPNGRSPYDEYLLSVEKLRVWYKAFPKADVCIGNHDERGIRRIYSSGLPAFWLKSLELILDAPSTYNFKLHHVIDDVFYTHGTGVSGDGGAMKIAEQNRQSAVIGHLHSVANIKYSASYKDLIFAMTVGCGIDYKTYAFNYGRDMPAKPIICCGVVQDGRIPTLIPMEL